MLHCVCVYLTLSTERTCSLLIAVVIVWLAQLLRVVIFHICVLSGLAVEKSCKPRNCCKHSLCKPNIPFVCLTCAGYTPDNNGVATESAGSDVSGLILTNNCDNQFSYTGASESPVLFWMLTFQHTLLLLLTRTDLLALHCYQLYVSCMQSSALTCMHRSRTILLHCVAADAAHMHAQKQNNTVALHCC